MTSWLTNRLFVVWVWMIICFTSGLRAQTVEADRSPIIFLPQKSLPLSEILSEIERQAGVTFSYESSLLDDYPTVCLQADHVSLSDCLRKLFASYPITYKQSGNVVILKRKRKQITISGFVREDSSSESLIGASVYDVLSRKGSATNSYGFFSLTLPPGNVHVQTSYIGYENRSFYFSNLEKDTVLYVALKPNMRLEEVVVTAADENRMMVNNTAMGALEFNQQEIKSTPTLFGESDVVKTLQLTPGVSSGTEGFAGLYVRGGEQDGNLFLMDGNPIYQVNHVGGLFTAFNPEVIRNMDFYKAGFPARYGGRLSSVIDVHTKEGNMKEYHGSASLGLISGNVSLEGPIVKDRTSFQVALRRSWLDLFSAPTIAILNKINEKYGSRVNFRYAFHDLNIKLNHHFNDRSRMFFSLYNGNDFVKGGATDFSTENDESVYRNEQKGSLRWGNIMATLGWTYVFNNRLFGRVSGVFSRYRSKVSYLKDYSMGESGVEDYMSSVARAKSQSAIMDFGVRSAFDFLPSPSHRIRFGGDFMMHRFRPEYHEEKVSGAGSSNMSSFGKLYTNDLLWGSEAAVFAEDDWTIVPALRLNAGLRFSLFHVENKTYTLAEPRASLRWLICDDLSFKSSYARMGQYVHLLSNSYINLPTDAWMPVTSRLKPLVSDQVSAGFYYNWKKAYTFSVEGYYKWMHNLLDFKDGAIFLPGTAQWEEKMAVGSGRTYGVEWMARKDYGRLTGWLGYTLSWSDRKFAEIDRGQRFPARYDNRHRVNVVASFKLSKKVDLTAAWTFASGNHQTLSLENYEQAHIYPSPFPGFHSSNSSQGYGNGYGYNEYFPFLEEQTIDYYTRRNNYQLPAYHRLDVGVNIYRPKKKGRMGIWNISVYNAYSRMNPFVVYKSDKMETVHRHVPGGSSTAQMKKPCYKSIGIMPIIPSVSYTYKF